MIIFFDEYLFFIAGILISSDEFCCFDCCQIICEIKKLVG
jgi:hypothetical protein